MTTEAHASGTLRVAGAELLALSFIVLFQELALIRWLAAQVRVLAYFPNVVLISAFLGLGIGCLRAGRRSLLWLWPVSLVLVTLAASVMNRIAFTQRSVTEHLWLLYYDLQNPIVVNDVHLPIVVCFVLSCLSFIPLGQLVAERLRIFRERSAPLWGYSLDLLGSLLGVAGFAVASFLRTFPVVWFTVFLVPGLWFFWNRRKLAGVALYLAGAAAVLFLIHRAETAIVYSPYYALRIVRPPGFSGLNILANGSLHQYAAKIRKSDSLETPYDRSIRTGYHAPYRLLAAPPRRVLVLGAGSGNDVAVALDEGAEHVDAVEIDPVILQIGRDLHPNLPYRSPKVRAINDDARSFLMKTDAKYDLIIFGTLDSMTRLSALSNVRLDNFVYTRECIEAARARLAPGGGMALYFMVGSDYIHLRLFGLLTSVFGEPPLVLNSFHQLFNEVFLIGPAFDQLRGPRNAEKELKKANELLESIELPADDWPFLYLRSRGVSPFYLRLIMLLSLIAVVSVLAASADLRLSVAGRSGRPDFEMFFFGVAFLLLETKSVTEMNLIWGATWLTSAVVFGSILAMLLAATILMQVRPLPWLVAIGGLAASLVVSYFVPTGLLLGRPPGITLLLSMFFIGLPIFFASACFAIRFSTRESPDLAFGWNLLGAVAGGFVEFSSMAIGLRNLALVALAVYLLILLVERQSPAPQQPLPQEH